MTKVMAGIAQEVCVSESRPMAQFQAWSGARMEAIRTGSICSHVPLPIPTEQVRGQVSVPPRTTVTHDAFMPWVP
jgi:hypothetical protein